MATKSNQPVAVIIGVGPGLGAALARRFATAYAVAMLARKADYLKDLARELRGSGATVLDLSCDVSDRAQLVEAFRIIGKDLGEPEVLLYNAGSGTFGTITEITPEQYEADWRVNAFGAFVAAREVAPRMIARGRGTMLFTGATAGLKAGAKSVSFGPAKFAMRGLAHPRSVDQCRWQHRHPGSAWTKAQSERRRLSEARRDRRDLLASRAPGSERVDDGTRSPPLQGKFLIARRNFDRTWNACIERSDSIPPAL